MRKLLLGAATALLLAATLPDPSAASGRAYHYCSSFKAHHYTIRVYATNITCRKAVQIQREWWLGPRSAKHQHGPGPLPSTYYTMDGFPGWKCSWGSGGGSCRKGKRIASYQN